MVQKAQKIIIIYFELFILPNQALPDAAVTNDFETIKKKTTTATKTTTSK